MLHILQQIKWLECTFDYEIKKRFQVKKLLENISYKCVDKIFFFHWYF